MTIRWAAALTLLLAGCSGAGNTDQAPEPVALVKLAPVANGGLARQVVVYGAAEAGPMGRLTLVAPVEASVVAIAAPAGTQVQAGQVVVRLSASPVTRSDAAKANADAATAEAALARADRLRRDGLASDADVETARAAAVAARALRASFAARTGNLVLRAPATGVVDTVAVAVGDLLQPGGAIASVSRTTDLRARFGADPDTVQSIRPGMTIHIAPSATRGVVTTSVTSVSQIVDPQTRLAAIFASVPAGFGIAPGEALSATIDAPAATAAVSVPYAALLDDGGQAYVFVADKGTAHRRDVTVQSSSGERVTVTKGLRAGENVVVEGTTAVEDGMKVRTR